MRVASFHHSPRFASSSFDGTVRIWDGEKQEKVLFFFSEAIEGLSITPDDNNIIVVLAGNGKDDPAEIPNLLKPIIEEKYDYVQGSRFLVKGSFENTPAIRLFLVRAFTVFWRMLTGFTITDASRSSAASITFSLAYPS